MRSYFWIVAFLFSNSALASALLDVKPSNKTQFLSLIKDKQGEYAAKEGSDAVCQNASFSLIKTPTQGFSLGTLIDFSDLHNGTQVKKIPNFCVVSSKLKYFVDGIVRTKRYFRCDNEDDNGSTTEDLRFKDNGNITYTLSKPNVSCVFEKQ
ncbi:hypothetical protein [uncultured Pseudoalteromonas sp.]|uniref:hypothetical protein n=1 Tax=uncultured Pseudoalteromonas sp. TaxID=114053 RepID=UPI000C4C19BC|nr:hypothetical protein [uncultured Pseudoalteromonas sp.]MBD57625.1 hypothetical protein [Pseudoalteromonas sp.]|tara:strand:- start:15134 stop:15589 length:456 start_codon:yes stop_codon:yes gene_type:complete